MPDDEVPQQSHVIFDYIKGADFRTLRADGALGGITPRGMVHFVVYSERGPIPQRVRHQIMDTGHLSSEFDVMEGRTSIIREMQVDIFMDFSAAKSFSQWLMKTVEDLESRISTENEIKGRAKNAV